MKKTLLLLLGLLLIAILSLFCFSSKVNGIKSDLISKSNNLYESNGMNWVQTSIKGNGYESTRNLILRGVAPNAALRQKAEALAKKVDGVYSVDNQIVVAKPKIAAPKLDVETVTPTPYIILASKDTQNNLILSGYVDNKESHKKIVLEAKKIFGNNRVIDNLKEAKGAPNAWDSSTILALNKLSKLDYGEFNIKDNLLTIKGHVASNSIKEDILNSTRNELNKGYNFVDNIEAPKAKVVKQNIVTPYVINATKDSENKIILNGYIGSEENHKKVIEKIVSLYGEGNYIDNLKVAQKAPKEWESTIEELLEELSKLDYGTFSIKDSSINLKGFASSQSLKSNIISESNSIDSSYIKHYSIDIPKPKVEKSKAKSCQDSFKKLLKGHKILFKYNKSIVRKSSYPLLNQVAKVAKSCPNSKIIIEGHTDNIGDKKYNRKLSYARANAVKRYLMKKGIANSRLKAVGFGELRPIASNKTKRGREKNRRIELKVKGVK